VFIGGGLTAAVWWRESPLRPSTLFQNLAIYARSVTLTLPGIAGFIYVAGGGCQRAIL